ncbi:MULTISPECIES: RtcB family protein [Pseudomonas]|uniref:RtcB family protein n=1 Tax=Pseudomonas TaxID=286 RepID=UPI00029B0942|nr:MULTISPECIES: RtcB family protein [Pseudomonas]MBS7597997.1 RtcB family protein [Pseudomonas sp. RC2C2]MCP6698841.1 RtcB family protein [Pseudomonas donghuensis]PJY95484.1 RtcB family protein [Pseudomonas donghuensis]UVL28923.1 RtcB family protein [Pseudomonas donghuensis]WKY27800.1 RtcB family protein [Pseudomonas donghuensis]
MNILEVAGGKPIKLWTDGVPVDEGAREQLLNTAKMPFIFKHLAVMPDVHLGKGSTIGSVIPTLGAIIPAAVGVDIGCGMIAARTSLTASDLPDNLHGLRTAIEKAVPHGKTFGRRDQGAWDSVPALADHAWHDLAARFKAITDKYPKLEKTNNRQHLGTLGGGNHFIEVCLDEANCVWLMLHSGSRGVGNAIGNLFIELAQADMRQHIANLPDRNLAYFEEGSRHFADYVEAVEWAQDFARQNRALMMHAVIAATRKVIGKPFEANLEAVNCHHNYVQRERHFGHDVLITRKGAVSAQKGELGIIPGSMGAKSFIVRGLGNEESFCSCSHGAGRVMSRTRAKQAFTVEDQQRATAHVECRKDKDVIDEIPMAYKDIDAVMQAQRELVEVVHTLRQVVCVKG